MSKSSSVVLADPLAAWLSKAAAAAKLGVSQRTVERYIDCGRLNSRERHVSGRKPAVVVDPLSVSAELAGSGSRVVPMAEVERQVRAVACDPLQVVGELAAAIASVRPRAEAPWLTLDEAAEYSGLPRGWLLAQAVAGSPVGLNVGGGTRRSWRFNRELLGSGLVRSPRRAD